MKLRYTFSRKGASGIGKAHTTDTGIDLCAAKTYWLPPFVTRKVCTGIRMHLPQDFGIEIRPRSSLTGKGILVQPGTVDNGYRGEIKVQMMNLNPFAWFRFVRKGHKVAQMVLEPVYHAEIIFSPGIANTTARGEGGFGSTGK